MSKPSDLVQGTLDLLLLKILALEPMNGYAMSLRLKQVSGDVLQVSDGSLYPALHKLEQEAGSRRSGSRLKTIAAQSFIRSRGSAEANSKKNPPIGAASPPPFPPWSNSARRDGTLKSRWRRLPEFAGGLGGKASREGQRRSYADGKLALHRSAKTSLAFSPTPNRNGAERRTAISLRAKNSRLHRQWFNYRGSPSQSHARIWRRRAIQRKLPRRARRELDRGFD
jgi:hypothetical protein